MDAGQFKPYFVRIFFSLGNVRLEYAEFGVFAAVITWW
jgi:hypothetical protein